MLIKYSILKFNTNKKITENAAKLRGFIGNSFKEHQELHHHISESKYFYYYPHVQYKILDGEAFILGINESRFLLKEIAEKVKVLCLGNNTYLVVSNELKDLEVKFTYRKNLIKYNFLTPWLSFNQENYNLYKELLKRRDFFNLKKHLNSILAGNILSMSKSLNFVVNKELIVLSKLNQV
ncbi:MAG: CRISPR-associated endonuclease Cas6, partial [Candidatus Woesearchaeota archaeon]